MFSPEEFLRFSKRQEEQKIIRERMKTSYGRYGLRIENFQKSGKSFPKLQHWFWWILHNTIAHLLIAFVPMKPSFAFHDWTSKKLNLE